MEEDDDDFWGEDEEQTEEEKAQAAKELEEAKAKAMAKLAKKEANQRSLCNLEIKPWEADQDLKALYAKIEDRREGRAQVVRGPEIGRRRVRSPENHLYGRRQPDAVHGRDHRRNHGGFIRGRGPVDEHDVDVAALEGRRNFL